jgi:hypothetical protein
MLWGVPAFVAEGGYLGGFFHLDGYRLDFAHLYGRYFHGHCAGSVGLENETLAVWAWGFLYALQQDGTS